MTYGKAARTCTARQRRSSRLVMASTYTSFDYSALKTDRKTMRQGETVNVTLLLKNTGNYDSDEVVQLYVSFPESKVDRPALALKGFRRVHLGKG
ncbi:MAG: fibronectin type III-like domain-contianing protein [Marinilabiliales bacterium]|nr:fibronectin type III-like domain-contianing protein [Marinilabiliales bacterium]